jgi:integrase
MERFREADCEYERLLQIAVKASANTYDHLDAARIGLLADAYAAKMLAEDEEKRLRGEADPDWNEAAEDGFGELFASGNAERVRGIFEEDALSLAAQYGWRLDPTSEEFTKLCWELLKAAIRANDIRLARDAGRPIDTPPPPSLPPKPGPAFIAPPGSGAAKSFLEIAETILNTPSLNIGPSTQEASRTALRFFREVHGELTPRQITRRHAAELKNLLLQSPARRPWSERELPLPELVKRYASRTDVPRLKGKTVQQHLGSLATLWNKAQREGLIDETLRNPFTGHVIEDSPAPEDGRSLSREELQAIFSLPVFTRGERPTGGKGEASYWIPLLLLFTGARPEEIAQLLVSDIARDPETGEWTLKITDEGEHPAKGQRKLKTSKKGSGRRTIPVPKPLIELGFVRYVDWLRASGEAALFPKLKPKSAKKRHLYPAFGQWWSKYLADNGAKPSGRPIRDFRHNWTEAARKAGVSLDAQEYIQGHSVAHRSANVRYGSRRPLGREIHNVNLPVDISDVKPWEPPQSEAVLNRKLSVANETAVTVKAA